MAKKIKEIIEETLELVNKGKEADNKVEELSEAIATSMTMRSREAKINAAVAALAVKIALQKNDPIVHKMLKFRKLWKKYKDEVVKKYGPIAYQKFMQNQAKK